jgi:carboxymethylenebutenolidase
VADGYAADGYLVVAPAIFDRAQRNYDTGYTQPDIQAGVAIMQSLKWENTLADIAAAIDSAKVAGRVGILGYCFGGAAAWMAASRLPGLACAVPYYGGAIPNLIGEQPKCPVMFHWGETDHSIPLEAARKVSAAHPQAVAHYYPAGHGFNCDQRGSYDAAASKLARERTVEFLRKHIG